MINDTIVNLIKQHCPSVKLIYLFGSRAANQATTSSDWDIAVLNTHKMHSVERWEISNLLADACHAEVDFIDLLETSTVLKMQVIEHGKLLFDKDDFAGHFEMQVLSMYNRLQESRKDIIDDFVKKTISAGANHA